MFHNATRSCFLAIAAVVLITGALQALAKVPAAGSTGPVDINSASQAALEGVKGIGAATAKKIIANRPYKSFDELSSKAGIPAKSVEKFKAALTIGAASSAPASSAPQAAPAPAAAPAASAPPAAEKKPAPAASSGTASQVTPQTPPQKGMVWVNTSTKVFHKEGDEWYGKTKHGKFMTEEDALKAGYHESKEKQKKQ